jgi:hypothetical protein
MDETNMLLPRPTVRHRLTALQALLARSLYLRALSSFAEVLPKLRRRRAFVLCMPFLRLKIMLYGPSQPHISNSGPTPTEIPRPRSNEAHQLRTSKPHTISLGI